MNREKAKKTGYAIANLCGKLTRCLSIAALTVFIGGLISSIIVDNCERKEIKESMKNNNKK